MTLVRSETSTAHRRHCVKAARTEPGERRLNGAQTSGREYRNLSETEFDIDRTNEIEIPMRDGTMLRADVFLPTAARQPPGRARTVRSLSAQGCRPSRHWCRSRATPVRSRTWALRWGSSRPVPATSSCRASTPISSSTRVAPAARREPSR